MSTKIEFDPTIPVSFDSLSGEESTPEKRTCNSCKFVSGLLRSGTALFLSPFVLCSRFVSHCVSQVCSRKKAASAQKFNLILQALKGREYERALSMIDHHSLSSRQLVEVLKQIAGLDFPEKERMNDHLVHLIFESGEFRMDDDLRSGFRKDGLLPPIARRYFAELSEFGDESPFVRAIRAANPELEQDLWWNSDFCRDVDGKAVISNTTAKSFFMKAVTDQNENVLRAYQRMKIRLDGLQPLDDALAAGKLISSSWILKAETSLCAYTPGPVDSPTAKTSEERLKQAIDGENIGYITGQEVLNVSYPVKVDVVVDSDDAEPKTIMVEDSIVHSKESFSFFKKLKEKIKGETKRRLSPAEYALHHQKHLAFVCLIDRGYPMPKIANRRDFDRLLDLAYLLCRENAVQKLIDYRSQFLPLDDLDSLPRGFTSKYHPADLLRAIDEEIVAYISSQKPHLNETLSIGGSKEPLPPAEYALQREKYASFVCLIDAGYPMPESIGADVIAKIVPVACRLGKQNIAERLLRSLERPCVAVFQDAIDQDNAPFITAILKAWNLSSCEIDKLSPVKYALRQKKYAAAVCLMNAGFARPDDLEEETVNLLFSLSCRMGYSKVIFDLGFCKLTEDEVLRHAIEEESLSYLRDQRVIEVTFEGLSPSEYAAHHHKYNSLICLLEIGYPIPQNLDSETMQQVLDLASKMGKPKVVQVLSTYLKDTRLSPERGACIARNIRALVQRAIDEDDRELLKAIHEVQLYYPHRSVVDSPIQYALQKRNFFAVSCFLNLGIYPYDRSALQSEIYWAAIEHNHHNTLKLLLDNQVPLPDHLLSKGLERGYYRGVACILTHPEVQKRSHHPLHNALEISQNRYQPDMGRAFIDYGIDPFDQDESGKSVLMLAAENSDKDSVLMMLMNLVGHVDTPAQKKEIVKVMEKIAKKETFPEVNQRDKNTILFRGLQLFGATDEERVIQLSQYLEDFQIMHFLPEVIPGNSEENAKKIVAAFVGKLRTELDAFEGHSITLALEPLGQTVENMVQMFLGFKAMEKQLKGAQKKMLVQWALKIDECLKEAKAVESFLDKAKEFGYPAEINLQRLGKWMATLKKDDLSLLKVALRCFKEPSKALWGLCENVQDKELLQEILKEFQVKQLNEFGRELAFHLGRRVVEMNQIRGKASQATLMPMLEDMTKMCSFAKEMRGLDSKVLRDIQTQASKAKETVLSRLA